MRRHQVIMLCIINFESKDVTKTLCEVHHPVCHPLPEHMLTNLSRRKSSFEEKSAGVQQPQWSNPHLGSRGDGEDAVCPGGSHRGGEGL